MSFEPGGDQYRANNKVYLQGPHQLISEAGEWGLDSASATLYYWPRDAQAMEAGFSSVWESVSRSGRCRFGEGAVSD